MKKFLWSGMFLILFAPYSMGGESTRPQVKHGSASFQQNGGNWTINTNKNKTIINWNSFSVPAGTTTTFNQPKPSSSVLNRVTGPLASGIHGSLLSNGRVFLINPNGIVVGKQGIINTRGFVASILDVSDASYVKGRTLRFMGNSEATIVNLGDITASGDDVILIGPRLENHGAITAQKGKVALVAGYGVALTRNNQTFFLPSDKNIGGTGVLNTGDIQAVRAELLAYGSLYAVAINNKGTINATSAVREYGSVLLRADGGVIRNSGTLSANKITKNGKTRGGTIQVLGEVVILEGEALLDVSGDLGGGAINVGGNFQGQGPLPNALQVWVGDQVSIKANALEVGDGGKIILWSDYANWYYGNAEAKGGPNGGDGGFAEVSGKEFLTYKGQVDLTATQGSLGTLLLDPATGNIMDGAGDGALDGNTTFAGSPSGVTGQIIGSDVGPTLIYESELEAMVATADVIIQMTQDLTVENLSDNLLDLTLTTGSLTLIANTGEFKFIDPNDVIRTEGGAVSITAAKVSLLGGIDTTGASGTQTGGTISITNTDPSGALGLGNNLVSLDQVTLNSPGGITQAAGTSISSQSLSLVGGGTIDLNTSIDSLSTVGSLSGTLSVTNNKVLAIGGAGVDVSGDVSLTTTSGGIVINQNLSSGGQVTLNAAAGTSGTQVLSANELLLVGSGNFNLNTSINVLATGDLGGGSLNVSNDKTLTVGSVGGNIGVTATAGISLANTGGAGIILSEVLDAGTGTINLKWLGALTLNGNGGFIAQKLNLQGNVNSNLVLDLNNVLNVGTTGSGLVGSGTVQLNSSGSLTSNVFNATNNTLIVNSAGWFAGSVTAEELALSGSGSFNLNTTINTLAANVDGILALSTSGALNVGSVAGVNGITTNGNNLTLITGNTLRINSNMDTGTGFVFINAATGGVVQGANGSVSSDALELSGSGDFIFDHVGNRVPLLAANVSGGDLTVVSSGNLTVGSVINLNGIIASNAALLSLSSINGYVELLATILANGAGSGLLTTSGDVRPSGTLTSLILPGSGDITLAAGALVLPAPATVIPPTIAPLVPDGAVTPAPSFQPGGPGLAGDLLNPVDLLASLELTFLNPDEEWELKLPKELIKAKLTLGEIFKQGFDDAYLPIIMAELQRSEDAILAAKAALVVAGPFYHALPDDHSFKQQMAATIRRLKRGQREVRTEVYQVEYFLKSLYLGSKRDRVNQNSFKGALESLRFANEVLRLHAPVLNAYAEGLNSDQRYASMSERLDNVNVLTVQAMVDSKQAVRLTRKKRDRLFDEVLYFSWEE